MKRGEHDDSEHAAGREKRRCHTQHHCSNTPSAAAAPAEHTPSGPIPRSVVRELAKYKTQNRAVVNAVRKYYRHNRHTSCTGNSASSAETLFESSIRQGDLETVKLLLSNGVHVDVELGDSKGVLLPLYAACEGGHLEIVRYLVAHGTRVAGVYGVFGKKRSSSVSGVCEELGKSPLSLASRGGHLGVVKWLVENGGPPVDDQDYDGKTPLVGAVLRGDLEITRYLVTKGAVARAKGNASESAWYFAVEAGKRRILECLVESGLTTDLTEDPLLGSRVLECATKQENLGILRYLLALGVFSGTQMNECLGIATKLQSTEIMKLLVSSGANVNARAKSSGVAPVFHAIRDGTSAETTTETLLSLGADISRTADNAEYPALHLMAIYGRVDLLKLVQRVCGGAAAFNTPSGEEEYTPLHLAASYGHVAVVDFLLEVLPPADFNVALNVEMNDGNTVLYLAARRGHLDVMRLLVSKGAAAINPRANRHGGPSALVCAAESGLVDAVQFVCEINGDENVQWERTDCVNALSIAARRGDSDIVEYLCELWKEADFNTEVYDMTALREAVIYGRVDVVRVLLAHNVHASDDQAQLSALVCQAIVSKYTGVIASMLVKKGACVNVPCARIIDDVALELTPLLVAAGCGNLEMVKYLCENGADVESVSNQNETALFFASAWDRLNVVEYLVSKQNANIQSVSSYGYTPAEAAFASKHDTVYLYLASHRAAPPKREFLEEDSYDELLIEVTEPLTGDLAVDVAFWRRKCAVETVLIGGFPLL